MDVRYPTVGYFYTAALTSPTMFQLDEFLSRDVDLCQAIASGDSCVLLIVPMAIVSLENPNALRGVFQMSKDKWCKRTFFLLKLYLPIFLNTYLLDEHFERTWITPCL
jgi:hypothetical protein